MDKVKHKLIRISDVSKCFGDNPVLTSVNMQFEIGKISCLMGESGIGKTTLLRILMGLEGMDSGKIDGISNNTKFSSVFQEDRLCENLTAVGNILMVCDKKVLKEDIKNTLKKILPENSLSKKVSNFSGGMRQRVAIVRAMMAKSEVILMDEPFKGLDEDTKNGVITYIKNNQNDRTIIVVTHNTEDAQLLCAPICVLTKN